MRNFTIGGKILAELQNGMKFDSYKSLCDFTGIKFDKHKSFLKDQKQDFQSSKARRTITTLTPQIIKVGIFIYRKGISNFPKLDW